MHVEQEIVKLWNSKKKRGKGSFYKKGKNIIISKTTCFADKAGYSLNTVSNH